MDAQDELNLRCEQMTHCWFYRDDEFTSWGSTMLTEQLSQCFEVVEADGEVWIPLNQFNPPPPPVILNYRPFQCGHSDVVLYVACYGVIFCAVYNFYVSRRYLVRFM